ncbi:MAG: amidohydrolase [Flavobacteriales bacterium]
MENDIIELRRAIHQNPDLSGDESETAKRIVSFYKNLTPDGIIENIGGDGLAFCFKGKGEGQRVLLRCELDGLPIQEENDLPYNSVKKNVSHKCGHDGHMAILAETAKRIARNKPDKGEVVFLYQPSEETGEGAERVIKDDKFSSITPDYSMALHNLPGYPHGTVVLKYGTFAAASKGMEVKFMGNTSHAGEPENATSPSLALADSIRQLNELANKGYDEFVLITIIHALLGEIAFGTTPGYAELRATLRAFSNTVMDDLTNYAVNLIEQNAKRDGLSTEIGWREEFPATISSDNCVNLIQNVSKELGLNTQWVNEPFRWSEDFGHFTALNDGILFGLGSGENQPDLHHPAYDFPEEIISTGADVFENATRRLLK